MKNILKLAIATLLIFVGIVSIIPTMASGGGSSNVTDENLIAGINLEGKEYEEAIILIENQGLDFFIE